MPAGKHRSRTFRRVFVKTPGGKTVLHYRSRKPGKAHCATCHHPLPGVPRGFPGEIARLPKTARRPERPYGGKLCSPCLRKFLKAKAQGVSI